MATYEKVLASQVAVILKFIAVLWSIDQLVHVALFLVQVEPLDGIQWLDFIVLLRLIFLFFIVFFYLFFVVFSSFLWVYCLLLQFYLFFCLGWQLKFSAILNLSIIIVS